MLGLVLAVLIGVSLGLLGGGGSILTVPVLIYVVGVPVKEAIPMSLVVVGLTSALGAVRHARAGAWNRRALVTFGPTAMLGALGGAELGLRVSARFQMTLFALVLLAAASAMWRGGLAAASRESPRVDRGGGFSISTALIGGGVGVLTGMIGVGGGFMYVPALVLLAGVGMKEAVGTSLALIVMGAAASLARYAGSIALNWTLVVGFTICAFIGVWIGSALVPRVSPQVLRKGFAVLMLLMGVLIMAKGG